MPHCVFLRLVFDARPTAYTFIQHLFSTVYPTLTKSRFESECLGVRIPKAPCIHAMTATKERKYELDSGSIDANTESIEAVLIGLNAGFNFEGALRLAAPLRESRKLWRLQWEPL